jgi:competence protein CoiA
MMYALDELGIRKIIAKKGKKGICSGCNERVIAKCGEIKMWHWAHKPDSECSYSTAPETYWHRHWKTLFPSKDVEVVLGSKRADIYFNNLVIELQNSNISVDEIKIREMHYKNMVWLINGEHFDDNFELREKDNYFTFRWKWSRKSWQYSKCKKYIDFHDDTLFLIKKLYDKGGWGVLVSKEDFFQEIGLKQKPNAKKIQIPV